MILLGSLEAFPHSGDTKAQIFNSYQVVVRCVKVKLPGNLFDAPVHGLAYSADGLHPAKAFFNPFSDSLADGVVRMFGCSTVNGRFTVGIVLGHMRSEVEAAQFLDEFSGVVAFVAAQGNPPSCTG